MEDSSDYVALEISADGGTWTELHRFAGPADESAMQPYSFDISAFVGGSATFRFSTSYRLSDYDRLYLDNVQVEYTVASAPPPPPPPPPEPTGQVLRDEFQRPLLPRQRRLPGLGRAVDRALGVRWAGRRRAAVVPDGDGYALRIHQQMVRAYRTANLSGATWAELQLQVQARQFRVQRCGRLFVSRPTAGCTFASCCAGTGPATTPSTRQTVLDLTPYISTNTVDRL